MLFPFANDWENAFRPAILALLNGGDIYSVVDFYNVCWAIFPLIPFALLPYDLGRALMFACAVAAFGLVAWRFKASPLSAGAFVLSPLAFGTFAWGNIEWLALLGLVMPPSVGIFLLLTKPHMTIVAILWLMLRAYQRGGVRAVFRLGIIPAIALTLSTIVYGFWFFRWTPYLGGQPVIGNLSFFPMSVPIGLALSWFAFRKQDSSFAVAASPCFFPVVAFQIWIVSLIPIVRSTRLMVLASIGLWVIVLFARGVI